MDSTELTTCSYDVAWDCTFGELLEFLEDNGNPRIVSYVANGPAGGNPMLTLEFAGPVPPAFMPE